MTRLDEVEAILDKLEVDFKGYSRRILDDIDMVDYKDIVEAGKELQTVLTDLINYGEEYNTLS